MTTPSQMPQLTLADLQKHGWAAEAFSAYFNVHDGRSYHREVLTHLDSIVMERADEMLRQTGQNTTLRERLAHGGPTNATLVSLTLNNVITQLVMQCKTFDGVYGMAKDSLYEQQFTMALTVARTAVHRLADMEEVAGLGPTPTIPQMAAVAVSNPEIEKLSHELTGCLQQMMAIHRSVSEYEPMGAQIIMRAVTRKLAPSPWYQFGMSVGEAASTGKPMFTPASLPGARPAPSVPLPPLGKRIVREGPSFDPDMMA